MNQENSKKGKGKGKGSPDEGGRKDGSKKEKQICEGKEREKVNMFKNLHVVVANVGGMN